MNDCGDISGINILDSSVQSAVLVGMLIKIIIILEYKISIALLINLVLICFAISKTYDCALPYLDDLYNASVGTFSQTNAAANKRDYAQKSTATKKQFG